MPEKMQLVADSDTNAVHTAQQQQGKHWQQGHGRNFSFNAGAS